MDDASVVRLAGSVVENMARESIETGETPGEDLLEKIWKKAWQSLAETAIDISTRLRLEQLGETTMKIYGVVFSDSPEDPSTPLN